MIKRAVCDGWKLLRSCLSPALLGVALVACQSEVATPPDHLLGMWRTNIEPYQHDTLEIRSDRVLLGKEQEVARAYMITKVQEAVEKGRTVYSISYRDPDLTLYELAFFYDPAGGGTITFKNQSHLRWTKKGSHL